MHEHDQQDLWSLLLGKIQQCAACVDSIPRQPVSMVRSSCVHAEAPGPAAQGQEISLQVLLIESI